MKKLMLLPLLLVPLAHGFIDFEITSGTSVVFLLINAVTAFLVIMISADLYKFINITRKNIIFVLAYLSIGLLLFSSTLNIFYYFIRDQMQYLPVYFIDRLIILVLLVLIMFGFKKFRKVLGTKV